MSSQRHMILTNIKQTLSEISEKNGYLTTVKEVSFEPKDWDQLQKFPVLYILADEETIDHEPDMTEHSSFVVMIIGYTAGARRIQDAEELVADVKKAIGNNITLGGHAERAWVTRVVNLSPLVGDRGIVQIDLSIDYFYDAKQP